MKKIFSLMLAFACALFVGVSCTPNQPVDDQPITIGVTGAPEANLAPEAGEFSLNYTLTNAPLTAVLSVTTEAAWLHVGEVGVDAVPFTYDANTEAPGSPAREAAIVFAVEGAESVTVVVKQDSAAPAFAVEFLNVTPQMAQYVCTPVDNEMLYLLASSQDLGQYGVQGETPAELMKNYAEMLAMYGMLTGEADQWFVFQGANTEMPKEASRWSAEESVTVYAIGLSVTVGTEVNPDTGMPDVAINYLTPAHAWEVPFLPYPSLTIAEADLTKTVTAAAGEVTIDCVVENPIEGTEMLVETEAAWVVPTWADGKLTLAYEANTAAVARRASIAVSYGYYTNPVEIILTQEKDATAVAVTLNIEVVGTQFNGIIVNVTPSDANATYALNQCAVETDWETGAVIETDWMSKAEELLSYTGTATFHQGTLTNHFIKMNPSNYQWSGYDYYVYAVPVAATSEGDNWTVSQILGEVAYKSVTIDASKMPSLEWDLTKTEGLVWNENNERYDLEVVENSTVVLHFNVINPVEGALVVLNGTSLYDSYNVVDGEPVIDNAAGTITLKIDKFDTAKKYHYVSPTFKYTNAEGDTWGITTPGLRLTQVQAPVTEIVLTPDQIADINKAGSYYLADGTNQDVTNEATWLKWTSLGINIEACRVLYASNTNEPIYNGLFQFQGDASDVGKQGFLGNVTSNGEVKQVIIETYSSYATPSFNLYYGDAKLPKDAAKVIDVTSCCVKGDLIGKNKSGYDVYSFTCTFEIPAGNEYIAVRNDSKGATYIKNITIKY